MVDVGHGLAGHPRIRGDGVHHVQREPQVGVAVHVDRVAPEEDRELDLGIVSN